MFSVASFASRRSFLLRALLSVAAWALSCAAHSYSYPVRVEQSKRGVSAVDLTIVNDGLAPVNVVIELTAARNTGFSPNVIGSKFPHYLEPGTRKVVTTAVPLKRGKPSQFAFRFRYAFGNSTAVSEADVTYRLPFADQSIGVVRPYSGEPLSNSQIDTSNSVEFLLPVGTPVIAARDGTVIDVRSRDSDSGPAPSYVGNYVTILHDDGTWANYGWLLADSLVVAPGDLVRSGQVIGQSSKSPHSHESFIVFTVNRNFFGLQLHGVPVRFKAQGEIFDIGTRAGPVSQGTRSKYPVQSLKDEPWNPPESLVPSPGPPVNYYDELLTPVQRQALYRQRIIDRANAGNDTISGSKPLIALAFSGVLLGCFGFLAASASASSSRPSGLRGAIWSMLRGSGHSAESDSPLLAFEPQQRPDDVNDSEPSTYSVQLPPQGPDAALVPDDQSRTAASGAPLPDQSSTSSGPGAQVDGARTPNQLDSQDDAVCTEVVAPHRRQVVDHPRNGASQPRRATMMSESRLAFFALLRENLPRGLLCTAGVPESSVTESVSPGYKDHLVDFVLLSEVTGEIHAAILFGDTPLSNQSNALLSTRLAASGVDTLTFEKLPSVQELVARLSRLPSVSMA